MRNLHSKFWWFTLICDSHYVSHFTAFFIVYGTKTSTKSDNSFFKIIYIICFILLNFFYCFFFFRKGKAKKKATRYGDGSLLLIDQFKFYKNIKLCFFFLFFNDPSADSSTDTLLRLLLPLRHKIWAISEAQSCEWHPPEISPDVAIGRSDGRCVQRVVTKSACVDDTYLLDIPRSRQIIAIVYPNWWKDFKRFPVLHPRAQ